MGLDCFFGGTWKQRLFAFWGDARFEHCSHFSVVSNKFVKIWLIQTYCSNGFYKILSWSVMLLSIQPSSSPKYDKSEAWGVPLHSRHKSSQSQGWALQRRPATFGAWAARWWRWSRRIRPTPISPNTQPCTRHLSRKQTGRLPPRP